MKKLLFTALLFLTSNTLAAVAESAAVDAAPVTESSAIIASSAAISASRMAAVQAQQQEGYQQTASQMQSNDDYAMGVLECDSDEIGGKGVWDYTGCQKPDGSYESIAQYFNDYKPSWANKIIMVIMDTGDHNFDIYYR